MSEKGIAIATGCAGVGVSGLMWGLDHIGVELPKPLGVLAIVIGIALLAWSATIWVGLWWPRLRWNPFDRTMSLREAAIKLHEECKRTENFFKGKPGANPDEILDRAGLFILHSVATEAKMPPSTKWERLPQSEVDKLMVDGGATVLTDINSDAVLYTEPRVKRKDLGRLVTKEKAEGGASKDTEHQ